MWEKYELMLRKHKTSELLSSTTGDILLHGENLGMLQAALLLSLHYSSAEWLLPVYSSYAWYLLLSSPWPFPKLPHVDPS